MSVSATNLLRLLCVSAAIMLAAAALTFVVDPLQLFRPARLVQPMYSNDVRMQNAGLIRSQQFDTVLMGTSLAIHFRQSDIDKVLGGRALKLAMQGSNSHEQAFVLEQALSEGQPKRVIWEMDDWIFCDAPEIRSDIYLPAGLYRREPRAVAGYLFSAEMARESILMVLHSVPWLAAVTNRLAKFSVEDADDINTLPRNASVPALYNAQAALAGFARITSKSRAKYLAEGYGYESEVRNFERDTVELIARHPDVTFDIYLPPYSILQWVAMRDAAPEALKIVYALTARIAQRLVRFHNVRLFDFRAVAAITHNLGNYSDVIHHSPEIDLQILAMLSRGEHVIDPAAPLASLQELKAQVGSYRVTTSGAAGQ